MTDAEFFDQLEACAAKDLPIIIGEPEMLRLAAFTRCYWVIQDTKIPGTNCHQVRPQELTELVREARVNLVAQTLRKLTS